MTTAAQAPGPAAAPQVADKGLQHDSVGLLAAVAMSVSSVAPAYALTATLGLTVTEVGLQTPAIFLVGFVPMLLVSTPTATSTGPCPTPGHRSPGR